MATRWRALGVLAILVVMVAACSGGGASTAPSADASAAVPSAGASVAPSEAVAEPVTIEWWHIQNNDPGKSLWQDMADEFTADHPNVTIEITVLENDTSSRS